MAMVRISSKGQMVIPKGIREKLGLTPKKPVVIELVDDYAVVKPVPDVRKALRGSLKGKPSMTRALMRDHQAEIKQDEKISF